jgi:hypothetical protein
MADELYNGPAKRIDDFYSSKEAFRDGTDELKPYLQIPLPQNFR